MDQQPSQNGEVFHPSQSTITQARLKNWEQLAEKASTDLEGFWADEASELEWFRKWDKVLDDSKKPFYQWFVGAQTP